MNTLSLYVAGKYSVKTLDGGWACIIDDGNSVREFCGGKRKTSSNRMTLIGMIFALQSISHLQPGSLLKIETDSPVLAEGLSGKAYQWKAKGWKNRTGMWLPHNELWRRILKLVARFELEVTCTENPQDESILARAQYLCRAGLSSEKPLSIYVDGSFYPQHKAGGWGAVIDDQGSLYEASGFMPIDDNNLMELIAVIRSLELVENRTEAILYTDSQYVQIGSGKLAEWKANNWKSPSGVKVKNHQWWQHLDALLSKMDVRIEWVKGHSGIPHNVTADKLAGKAARSRMSTNAPVRELEMAMGM